MSQEKMIDEIRKDHAVIPEIDFRRMLHHLEDFFNEPDHPLKRTKARLALNIMKDHDPQAVRDYENGVQTKHMFERDLPNPETNDEE
jgi:hypothetical protein